MTPMNEIESTLNLHPSRLPSAEQLASIGRELLAEVYRLKDMPPDVAEAIEEWQELQTDHAARLLAAHFTELFQKGNQP